MRKTRFFILLVFLALNLFIKSYGQDNVLVRGQIRAHKVFAHYMFQWGTNWIGKCYLRPLIGEYDQLDPDVMEYHILLARAARIDGFIMNPTFFRAGNNIQNQRVFALTDAIGRLNREYPGCNIKYIFSYDDNNSAKGDRDIIRENYQWVRDNVVYHPDRRKDYFRDDATGKSVMMVWCSQGRPYHYEAIGDFFSHDSVTLMVRETMDFEISEGNFPWISMRDCANLADSSVCWGENYLDNFFAQMGKQKDNTLMIGNVYPGFDDRLVHGWSANGPWRYMKRVVNDGEVMALTWDKNINFKSTTIEDPWIQITTWNDWPEGTSIEPAELKSFGYQAIQTCRRKILDFKGISTVQPDDSLGVLVPYEIFQLRKQGKDARADSTLNLFMARQYKKALQVARGTMPAKQR
jgi:hypothetical protein